MEDSVLNSASPHAHDIEETVLGGLMVDTRVMAEYSDLLSVDLFHKPENILVAKAILSLWANSNPVDILSVTNQLRADGALKNAGGPHYISQLTNRVASTANTHFHIRVLQQYAMRRKLLAIAQEAATATMNDAEDVFLSIESLEKGLLSIYSIVDRGRGREFSDIVDSTVEQIALAKARRDNNEVVGVATPFDKFNRETGGFQKSDMIVVAGRPGMGKTTFVLNIADYAANLIKGKLPGVILSMEMSSEQLVSKILSKRAKISTTYMRKGYVSDENINEIANHAQHLKKYGTLIIDDTPALTPYQLKSKARKYKAKYGIEWIIIDYLQLMRVPGIKSREVEISTISGSCKALAKELNVPVIALSQLSRAVETRGGEKRPQLSDLRESGAIEQDADMVIFLYRPEYYGITEDADGDSTAGLVEGIVSKHRNGGLFEFNMTADLANSEFKNYESPSDWMSMIPPDDDFEHPNNN